MPSVRAVIAELPETTPASYARRLLNAVGQAELPLLVDDCRDPGLLWAQSGAMWLSGHQEQAPRACSAPLAACAHGAWLALASMSPNHFDPGFEAYALLGERAALAELKRQGRRSPGGACALYEAADGALALNLAREDDFSLLPAWLEADVESEAELPELIRLRNCDELVERGRLLGLAVSALARPKAVNHWFRSEQFGSALPPQTRSPLVVDMSSLWAGPLCSQLLRQAGARVIKLESVARPDGARQGPATFFQLMNEGKEGLALDHRLATDRARLRNLLGQADIVIESARPRGLEQMGIYAEEILTNRPGMVWLGISGYGRLAPQRDWIAYGDDAGVAAGLPFLMGADGSADDPVFCGDAIADPLTGLHAALLAFASWRAGGGQLLDIALRDVVAFCTSQPYAAQQLSQQSGLQQKTYQASQPQARQPVLQAPELGENNAELIREFAL